MAQNEALMQEELNNQLDPDTEWEEEWHVVINDPREPYILGKKQARLLQEIIASGSRGIVMFESFSISIPYIKEFYRKGRPFLKDAKKLPERATEPPYKPISPEKLKEIRENLAQKLGWPEKGGGNA